MSRKKKREINRKGSRPNHTSGEKYTRVLFSKRIHHANENKNKTNPIKKAVSKRQILCRRYQDFHDKFLNYDKIIEFLRSTKEQNSNRVQLVQIGKSGKGRIIYMLVVTSVPQSGKESPKIRVMVEAGLNGQDYMAVSNAIYLIYFLIKNPNYGKIADYNIIPCSNPDAYDALLRKLQGESQTTDKQTTRINLSLNFPVVLGINNMNLIPTDCFIEKIKLWKQNYDLRCPETKAVLAAITAYQFTIKLFISLQGNGERICYPFGFCNSEMSDIEDLAKVAKKAKYALKRCFQYGSIYSLLGLTYGSLIDFLKVNSSPIKFTYNVQVGNNCRKIEDDAANIVGYGQEMAKCLLKMTCGVYKFYNKPEEKKVIETQTKPNIHR